MMMMLGVTVGGSQTSDQGYIESKYNMTGGSPCESLLSRPSGLYCKQGIVVMYLELAVRRRCCCAEVKSKASQLLITSAR